jgi:serine/threonine-protein kinase PknG
MDGLRCSRNGCNGTIEDGYCDLCGMAELKSPNKSSNKSSNQPLNLSQRLSANNINKSSRIITNSSSTNYSTSSASSRSSKGSRRSASSSNRSTRRKLGAGLVSIPELPSTDPEKAILPNPQVPENKRFCSNCNNQLGRERGFCSKCGQKYSFIPSLKPNDLLVGQYEVKGAIAYGGLGWIYLGFDKLLSRYVVLKGLLNSEDAASAAVAVAERQFLAAVKHPNIVGIYNFVNHGSEGFIVMEYVGGKTLKDIRKSRGPLPVDEAIAYIHRILNAFAYLHHGGLVYCDFKPDNMMLEGNDVKLIDLGGVRRLDDTDGDIYGTVGYTAPEVADSGPSIVSDLFTVGRTLAVLVTNISGFSGTNQYQLPSPHEEPLFAANQSLYRFLLKATAQNPDDRFQSADEMAEQLLGVLREVVAISTGIPRPSVSNYFGADMLALTSSGDLETIKVNYQHLPMPIINSQDPSFYAVVNASAISNPAQRKESLQLVVKQFPDSREASLRYANSLIDVAEYVEAEKVLERLQQEDPWDWQVQWYRGRALLAASKRKEAQQAFEQVYSDNPGELAPKLAIALAAEQNQDYTIAINMYNLVATTDPSYNSAVFGLARCWIATGENQRAIEALKLIPPTSNLFIRARVEMARTLLKPGKSLPKPEELKAASSAIENLSLTGMDSYKLKKQIFETALNILTDKKSKGTKVEGFNILGKPMKETNIRESLEETLRQMAKLTTGKEKFNLVDQANQIRQRTIF